MSEFLRFYIEQCIQRNREQGKPIDPATLAKEVIQRFPNYRHLRKRIVAMVVQMAMTMNSVEIAAQFRPPRDEFRKVGP
jgi:hypothetical protein